MLKEEQVALTDEIIEMAYRLLIRKFGNGGFIARNEAAFQLELGYILKTLGELFEFKPADKFHLEFETYLPLVIQESPERARVDILIRYQDDLHQTKAAIELKFLKKENHREPNNRYDVFKDLHYLEHYKNHGVDICYFILATDHSHYVNQQSYSPDTSDFDFRDNMTYTAGTTLRYKTPKPYGPDLALQQDYTFNWETVKDFFFLKVKI